MYVFSLVYSFCVPVIMDDDISVLGDLTECEWASALEDIEWEDVECDFACDLLGGHDDYYYSDQDESACCRINVLWISLLRINAALASCFQFVISENTDRYIYINEQASIYYDELVSVYGKQPGLKLKKVIQDLSIYWCDILSLNSKANFPFKFSFTKAREKDRAYLVGGLLERPDGYFHVYQENKRNGEDYIHFLARYVIEYAECTESE